MRRDLFARAARVIWPPAAYLALSVLMTWPLAAQLGLALPGYGDALQQTWILAWNAHALATDPLAVWQAPIFYPYPDTAAYHDHHLIQSLLGTPVIWLTGNPVLAHNLLILLSFALTGWGGYLLARDLVGGHASTPAQTWAAVIAGAAITFAAYRVAHIVQLNLLQTGWMLVALLFLRRLLRPAAQGGGRWRDAIGCGLFTGLQAANAFYYGFFTAILIAGYVGLWAALALGRRLRHATPLPWPVAPRLLLAGAIAALIAVPFLLPYLGLYQTLGIVRSVRELENWSAPLRAYLSVTASNRLYAPIGEAVVDSGEMVLFPGLLVAGLGLGALLWNAEGRRRTANGEGQKAQPPPPSPQLPALDLLFWSLVLLGAFVLSLGTGLRLLRFDEPLPVPLPYLLLYQHVPGFGSMRVPARWGWLVTVALALLAALLIARLLARLRRPWHALAGAGLLAAVLAEQAAFPLPLTRPVLAEVPAVYRWLGEPAQADIRTLIELPTGPLPRGDNLERITWRHFYSLHHWKRLPVAYGALIPFGAVDLMQRLEDLPAPEVLGLLQLVGVDTIVVHADEYADEQRDALLRAFDAAPLLRLRSEVGAARVYTLLPDAGLDLPAGPVLITNDERMPGIAVLGLIRRWQAEGRVLYGPGRLRYYAPLSDLPAGSVADYGLLSDAEDPFVSGFAPDGLLWRRNGLALYRRAPDLLASLDLARPVPPGRFHPSYPGELLVEAAPGELRIDGRAIPWRGDGPLTLELDVVSLSAQTLQIGDRQIALTPGLQVVRAPLPAGRPILVRGSADTSALLRARVRTGAAPAGATAQPALVAAAEARFAGSELRVEVRGAGAEALLLEIQGAAAFDDRPIRLLSGAQPLAAEGGPIVFRADLLDPAAPWVERREPPEDGRYIAYLKDAANPAGPGRPIAKFHIRAGQVVDAEPVPLPLTAVR